MGMPYEYETARSVKSTSDNGLLDLLRLGWICWQYQVGSFSLRAFFGLLHSTLYCSDFVLLRSADIAGITRSIHFFQIRCFGFLWWKYYFSNGRSPASAVILLASSKVITHPRVLGLNLLYSRFFLLLRSISRRSMVLLVNISSTLSTPCNTIFRFPCFSLVFSLGTVINSQIILDRSTRSVISEFSPHQV